jgi:hypothetical protein
MPPRLAAPRGPLTDMLCARLTTTPRPVPGRALVDPTTEACLDPLASEDLQLALHLCYGLHYDGFAGSLRYSSSVRSSRSSSSRA